MNTIPIKKFGERNDMYGKLLNIKKCTIVARMPHITSDDGKFSNNHKQIKSTSVTWKLII